jgi:cell division protein ZapA
MSDVRLSIAGREYIVTCKDGEEQRLIDLGNLVDAKAREAGGAAGGLNESRLLLFASLLLADQIYDSSSKLTPNGQSSGLSEEMAKQIGQTVERLADRIEMLVLRLEQSA